MMISRRKALATGAASLGGLLIGNKLSAFSAEPVGNSSFRHSVCRWCYSKVELEELCRKVKELGMHSVELLKPDEWAVAEKYGLECAVGTASFISLTKGFNDPANHKALQKNYRKLLKQAADAGVTQLICFSGNRNGIGEAEGLENCAKGLAPVVKRAERLGITMTMELLNSRKDHKDYQCDHTAWGVQLVDKIGSPNFKLLYDIYHMQIMEGDIITTIQKYHEYISHYHTAGVPGRHEIDESQELFYPAIMRAIAATGFSGFVGQEFIPVSEDKFAALQKAVALCDV